MAPFDSANDMVVGMKHNSVRRDHFARRATPKSNASLAVLTDCASSYGQTLTISSEVE
jgi:hypothetical protein